MATQNQVTEALVSIPASSTLARLLKSGDLSKLYEAIKTSAGATEERRVDTQAARDALASLAYKVKRSKTAVSGPCKEIIKEYRDVATSMSNALKRFESDVDQLGADIRAPLTEWENANKERLADIQVRFDTLNEMVDAIATADTQDLEAIEHYLSTLDLNLFDERAAEAQDIQQSGLDRLPGRREVLGKDDEIARLKAQIAAMQADQSPEQPQAAIVEPEALPDLLTDPACEADRQMSIGAIDDMLPADNLPAHDTDCSGFHELAQPLADAAGVDIEAAHDVLVAIEAGKVSFLAFCAHGKAEA